MLTKFHGKWLACLLLICISSGPHIAYANEEGSPSQALHQLPETVSNHFVLSAEQSPYVVSDEAGLTILPNGHLEVQAGVTIFMGNQPIVVRGELSINGTAGQQVNLVSSSTDFKKRGILIEEDATVHAVKNVNLENSSDGFIVTTYQKEGLVFDGVHIKNSFGGIKLVNSLAYITNSTFEDIQNTNAISLSSSTSTISNVQAINTDQALIGISLKTSSAHISSSTLSGFDTAIRVDRSKLFIENVKFLQNINGVRAIKPGGVIVSFIQSFAGIMQNIAFGNPLLAHAQSATSSYDILVSNSQFIQNTNYGILNDSTKTISAHNNEWGSETGPWHESNPSGTGDKVKGDVLFDPWIGKANTAPCCSNVLFLPGIQASRLYSNGALFGENQLWEPNRNADVEKLFLNSHGKSVQQGIYTRDVIDTTNIAGGTALDVDIYKGFINHMNALVSSSSVNKFDILPYDWRFDPQSISQNPIALANTTYSFIQKIRESASSSKTGKVTLIAHSYGGLVLKALINSIKTNPHDINLVDAIIFIATPHEGAPKSIAAILYGDDQQIGKGLILSKTTAQKLAENSGSAYELLPHRTFENSALISIDPSITDITFPGVINNRRILNRSDLDIFMKDMAPRGDKVAGDINETLLASSTKNISAGSAWSVPSSILAFQIAGTGLDTLHGLRYVAHNTCAPDERGSCALIKEIDHHAVRSKKGDGTVPLQSALKLPIESYTIALDKLNEETDTNFSHADIVSSTDVTNIVDHILRRATSTLPSARISYGSSAQNPSLLSTTASGGNIEISVHSPANILITDYSGRKTGAYEIPNSDLKGVLQEIPNSSYEEIGEGKYVTLSREHIKTVELTGTDYGSFTLRMTPLTKNSLGELVSSTSTTKEFRDVPVSPQTGAYIDWNAQVTSSSTNTSGLPQTLLVDFNDDGQYEGTYDATAIFISTSTTASSTSPHQYARAYKLFIAYLRHIMQSIHFPLSNVIKNILEQKIKNIELRLNQGLLPKTEKIKNQLAYITKVIAAAKAKNRTLSVAEVLSLTDKMSRLLGNI